MFSLISHPSRHRHAVTLVELLVALAVISVLASIALPTVKNTLRGQRASRAASLLQSAIQEGRARAIASGGGGVIIDRVGSETLLERSQSVRIRMADAPRPYTGDVGDAKATIGLENQSTPIVTDDVVTLWFPPTAAQMVRSARDIVNSEPTLINIGDIVSVASAGLPMAITEIGFGSVALRNLAQLTNADIPDTDVTNWVRVAVERPEPNLDMGQHLGASKSFQISKSPRPAIAMPIELPKGTAIDLTASGIGRFGNEFSPMSVEDNYLDETIAPFPAGTRDYGSIYVLFGARGEISRVVMVTSFDTSVVPPSPIFSSIPVTGDVHFLVGEAGETKTAPDDQLEFNDPDPLGDEAKDGKTPLLNDESIWVTIKSRSGEVVTSRWIDPTPPTTWLTSPWVDPNPPTSWLIPDADTSIMDLDLRREDRIRKVIARTRTGAVDARGGGL